MRKATVALTCILIAAVLLLGCMIAVPYFMWNINIFDCSGWSVSENGAVYYLSSTGTPMTGWQQVDGVWYYFNPGNGGKRASGWLELDGNRYYLSKDGASVTGWLELEDGTYYLNPINGIAATGWQELGGVRYHFGEDGARSAGWIETDGKRQYLSPEGTVQSGWLEENGSRYLLGADGTPMTGFVTTEDGMFYLDETTGAVTFGWIQAGNDRFFMKENGTKATGWLYDDTGRYYLDDAGRPVSGWLDTRQGRYYLNADGCMVQGWQDIDGKRYYFKENGIMAIGEVEIDGVRTYFSSTGQQVLLVNKWNPMPEDYAPELVKYAGHEVVAECYDSLVAMIKGCSTKGYYKVTSAYRSIETQKYIWNNRLNGFKASGLSTEEAEKKVAETVAVPGTSEHHSGLAVDIDGVKAVHNWLAEHSWEFGFIVRYPEGKTEVTGIIHEPWHFRYVGRELAKEIYESGLCLEEYMTMLTEKAAAMEAGTWTEE